MLLEFKVKNFLSFKDEVVFSMIASNLKGHEEDNVFNAGKIELLKSAVIYGANASGKTNLLAAMGFMQRMVLHSAKDTQSTEKLEVEPFRLSVQTENQPSEFEMLFMQKNVVYRYGFVIDREKIHKEWLYYVPKVKEKKLFERTEKNIELTENFKEGKGLESKTRKNALFLPVVDQFNGAIAHDIMQWFNNFNIISGIDHDRYEHYTVKKLNEQEFKAKVLDFLKAADIGIEDIQTLELKEQDIPKVLPQELREFFLSNKAKTLYTKRKKFDEEGNAVGFELFRMDNESEGTKKLFALSGPVIETLNNGEVLVVDELDAKLHPLMLRFILHLFHSADSNPKNAQLVFATHNTEILSNRFFRRDQVWFTEKNNVESTDLYSLAEYKVDDEKRVRGDASFNKDYIQGKYGAIPYVGDFNVLFGGEDGNR